MVKERLIAKSSKQEVKIGRNKYFYHEHMFFVVADYLK